MYLCSHKCTHTYTDEKSGDVLEVELFKQKCAKDIKKLRDFKAASTTSISVGNRSDRPLLSKREFH